MKEIDGQEKMVCFKLTPTREFLDFMGMKNKQEDIGADMRLLPYQIRRLLDGEPFVFEGLTINKKIFSITLAVTSSQ